MDNFFEGLKDYATIVMFILGAVVSYASTRATTNNRLNRLEEHATDAEKHWTTEKKIQVFVPRVEIEQRFENIERILLKLEKKF